jgi:acyl-CoA thioesterase FadM
MPSLTYRRTFRVRCCECAAYGHLNNTTYLSNIKRASVVRNCLIHRTSDNELVAQAQALWAFTNIETGRPSRIPASLLDDFTNNISEESA